MYTACVHTDACSQTSRFPLLLLCPHLLRFPFFLAHILLCLHPPLSSSSPLPLFPLPFVVWLHPYRFPRCCLPRFRSPFFLAHMHTHARTRSQHIGSHFLLSNAFVLIPRHLLPSPTASPHGVQILPKPVHLFGRPEASHGQHRQVAEHADGKGDGSRLHDTRYELYEYARSLTNQRLYRQQPP